jgi:hypothetical protein
MERRGEKRPLIFHRWGGLGNHRFQVGFSGDTESTWASLAFQTYFTPTAANVGFGYWSHDIGGHMPGPVDPELYTRWVQFGAFSPILRTHTTKNPDAERRIWAYPPEYARAMRDTFLLRYALIPYIYTASRQTYDTGVPFLRPMYFEYPASEEAYTFKEQYLFGDDMLVAPVVSARSKDTRLATKSLWLPPGTPGIRARLRRPGQLASLSEGRVRVDVGATIDRGGRDQDDRDPAGGRRLSGHARGARVRGPAARHAPAPTTCHQRPADPADGRGGQRRPGLVVRR